MRKVVTMKNKIVTMSLLLLLSGTIIVSCGGGDDAQAISAVQATIKKQRSAMGSFRTAPLNGGVAVLSSRDWAYWVKDGSVYAANGLAMSASPNIPTAPGGVGLSEIESAIEGK